MPDVTRSDSQRSDTSLRPRVSFNRDVHVKRIVPREGTRVGGALSGDGEGHVVTSPVRKQRISKSKQQLAKEAAEVLHQVDKLDCIVKDSGLHPNKYYTLPTRKKHHQEYSQSSLDRKTRRRNSDDFSELPPKKPPRTFVSQRDSKTPPRNSVFNIFKKSEGAEPRKSNLRRSISDASNLKSKSPGSSDDALQFRKRTGSETEENLSNVKANKKQLSPIIEVTQREDYFLPNNKENIDVNSTENVEHVQKVQAPARNRTKKRELSVTEKLKEYIDEIDTEIYKESGIRVTPLSAEKKQPEIVIIDVDKADQISSKKGGKKTKSLSKKLKSLTKKSADKSSNKTKDKKADTNSSEKVTVRTKRNVDKTSSLNDSIHNQAQEAQVSPSPKIKEAIKTLESHSRTSPVMIHSSQKPVEKLPLTRGRAVDNMVKRLSRESSSPPPKTNVMVTPNVTVQHNNNQPFSYTRGLSPEKNFPDDPRNHSSPTNPIIYAQVVCGNKNNPNKQTVHTTYINGKKNFPHSDSDEGLGYEENSGFGRKYETEKTVTHFGDEHYEKNIINRSDYYNGMDRFDEEFPITPKFKSTGYNGFGSYEKFNDSYDRKLNGVSKTEQTLFIDSSSRGRGDGMDSKRRESLTEPENGLHSKYNGSSNNINGRNDLSARRDLLESRITRRFGEKTVRASPEYSPKPVPTNFNNVYVTETTSRYYRSGSASPIGYKDKYVSEVTTDKTGERHKTESRTRKYIGENDRINYNNRHKTDEYKYNNFDSEPKSFDSQISDYRSSPENTNRHFETSHNYKSSHQDKYLSKTSKQEIFKDRDYYKSNPEINQKKYDYKYDDHGRYPESYHDSLKRENRSNSNKYHDDRYFDQTDSERKDKFGDSGIENDFRRDSGENFKVRSGKRDMPEACNESEDEGFASSLLIASERQHTEDNFARKHRREYDSNRSNDPYRHVESMEIKYKAKDRNEYAPRERSIDDGSHFDPRIDKDVEKNTLKKMTDKRPPKPEKKSGLEKMKQLFSRDSKKKKEKERNMVRDESLRARYTEYRGSREELGPKAKKTDVNELNSSYDYSNRRRLSTPSPSPTREPPQNEKSENTHSSWFKSLDRLSRKKSKKNEKESNCTEENAPIKQAPTKNLRFFGDTDIESNDSLRKSSLKTRPALTTSNRERTRSQSTRDLHNISEEIPPPEKHRSNHKSMMNISEASDKDLKGSRLSLKPPMSPNHRHREVSRSRDDRVRRRKNEVSSVESSTEGDSSQQSQRSVVYLHAATVGDIPGPGYLKNGRRAASREELASNGSSGRIQPQVKTLSRSFSVLAPWKPRHYRETMDIDYTQYPKPTKNGKYEQKVSKNGSSRKDNSSTLKKKAQETKRHQNVSTLNRKSRSKENISTLKRSKEELSKGSSSTLYKKKERQPKENTRYSSSRGDDKKFSAKSLSVESLSGSNSRTSRRSGEDNREVSRSISMPRDPEKSAGWFKMNKKSKK